MQVTRKGTVYQLSGEPPKVGEKAPYFELTDLADRRFSLTDFLGKPTILSIVPDIDTRVCALQTKRFNQEASQLTGVNFATISNNTKEEQKAWCGQEGVSMIMLHDPENTFGTAFGIMLPEFGHFARGIFVLDGQGVIQYEEIVAEISHEPDYQLALTKAKELL